MPTTLERVKNLIAEQLGLSWAEVTSDVKLISDLDADSLDQVELVIAFEDEFQIEIPDEVALLNQDSTPSEITLALEAHFQKRQGQPA